MLKVNTTLCTGCHLCSLACSLHFFRVANPAKGRIKVSRATELKFSINYCTECGICQDVCPEQAIKKLNGYLILDPETCTGCGSCVDACPEEALFTHPDLSYPLKCTHCGNCTRYCLHGAIMID